MGGLLRFHAGLDQQSMNTTMRMVIIRSGAIEIQKRGTRRGGTPPGVEGLEMNCWSLDHGFWILSIEINTHYECRNGANFEIIMLFL